MKLFYTGSKGKTTLNGEQEFDSYPTHNTKHMNFEVHSANGISGGEKRDSLNREKLKVWGRSFEFVTSNYVSCNHLHLNDRNNSLSANVASTNTPQISD
jgi:hypothetical protein